MTGQHGSDLTGSNWLPAMPLREPVSGSAQTGLTLTETHLIQTLKKVLFVFDSKLIPH
jgi:hypothetical protein